VLLAAQATVAQDNSRPTITGLRVGFAGSYKVGYWTPVWVTIHGGQEDFTASLTVTVPDGDGVPSRVTTPDGRPIQVRAGQDTEALLYAKFGQVYADATIQLRKDDRVFAERTYQSAVDPELGGALGAENELIVTLGPPIGIEVQERSVTDEVGQPQKTQIARLSDAAQLPARWYGFEGVDSLVITTSDPNVYRQLSANSARVEAIDQWIERGGKLVLSIGKEAIEVSADGGPLTRFLPGKVESLLTLRQAGGLETYADTTDRIDATAVASGQRFQLQAPKFVDVRGHVEAPEGNLPLVIRTAHGFGEIVTTAFDIDRPPITEWTAREALLNKLLGRTKRPETAESSGGRATTLGYDDLSGQLRSALDQFRGVRLVPFAIVAVLIASYILVIGPIDYWFVKRVLKRMELTWISFPLAVVAFSVAAYLLAGWLKGDQLRVNQVDVIDIDADRGLLRGTMWANVFSPEHDAYELSLTPKLPASFPPANQKEGETLLSWMGLPGSSLGGMAGGSPPSAFNRPYLFSSKLDRLHGVPIAVWSTKAFTARWTMPIDSPVAFNLHSRADGVLLGTVTSNLQTTLTDCYLLYGSWAWPLGRLEPGAAAQLDERSDPQRLDAYLKPYSAGGDVRKFYDPTTLEADQIVQAMSFYRAAGGTSYAQLANRYQSFIDISNQLAMGRAVLVAHGDVRTQLGNGDQPLESAQDQHWSILRIVTDIAPAGAE
jgi:hypothetical protein